MSTIQDDLQKYRSTSEFSGGGNSAYRVFISYVSEDLKIALQLIKELQGFSQDLRFFLDRHCISSGGNWRADIDEALRTADSFILIYTSGKKNYEFCMSELGQFRARQRDIEKSVEELTIFCLLDAAEFPSVVGDKQITKIDTVDDHNTSLAISGQVEQPSSYGEEFERTPLYRFFVDLLSKEKSGRAIRGDVQKIRPQIRESVASCIRVFVDNRVDDIVNEKPLHPRLEVIITRTDRVPSIAPLKAKVIGFEGALKHIGVLTSEIEWQELRAAAILPGGATAPWIDTIESGIRNILNQRSPGKAEVTFRSEDTGNIMRPVLARVAEYQSKATRIYISLIEQPLRAASTNKSIAIVAAMLVSALRFRSAIVPLYQGAQHANAKDETIRRDARNIIVSAELEAAELGLVPATGSVDAKRRFMDGIFGPMETEVEKLTNAWYSLRDEVMRNNEGKVENIEMNEVLRQLVDLNAKFLSIALQTLAYLEGIDIISKSRSEETIDRDAVRRRRKPRANLSPT